ncbi:hypothetical protein D3C85_1272800 [compost metagenome]
MPVADADLDVVGRGTFHMRAGVAARRGQRLAQAGRRGGTAHGHARGAVGLGAAPDPGLAAKEAAAHVVEPEAVLVERHHTRRTIERGQFREQRHIVAGEAELAVHLGAGRVMQRQVKLQLQVALARCV